MLEKVAHALDCLSWNVAVSNLLLISLSLFLVFATPRKSIVQYNMKELISLALLLILGSEQVLQSEALRCSRCSRSGRTSYYPLSTECFETVQDCINNCLGDAEFCSGVCGGTLLGGEGGVFPGSGDNGKCYCPAKSGASSDLDFRAVCTGSSWDYGDPKCDDDCYQCSCTQWMPCPASCSRAVQCTDKLYVCWDTMAPDAMPLDYESRGIDEIVYCGGIGEYLSIDKGEQSPCLDNVCKVYASTGKFTLDPVVGETSCPNGEKVTEVYEICSDGGGFLGSEGSFCDWNENTKITVKEIGKPLSGGAMDDPHFKTWAGKWYDYMGECDLHLVHAPNFAPGLNLTIDIRTTIRYDYSYIESAAVNIGEDTLEVASFGQYYLNGVSNVDVPFLLSGYPVVHTQPVANVHVFEIQLAVNETITIKTFKDMVSVKLVELADNQRFHKSVGMMGEFGTGRMLARDGVTLMEDPNLFAKEWQVQEGEPVFFLTTRSPQHPQECKMPTEMKTEKRRRLGESAISEESAKEACAHWKDNFDGCVHDVMATGDLELAAFGSF